MTVYKLYYGYVIITNTAAQCLPKFYTQLNLSTVDNFNFVVVGTLLQLVSVLTAW